MNRIRTDEPYPPARAVGWGALALTALYLGLAWIALSDIFDHLNNYPYTVPGGAWRVLAFHVVSVVLNIVFALQALKSGNRVLPVILLLILLSNLAVPVFQFIDFTSGWGGGSFG